MKESLPLPTDPITRLAELTRRLNISIEQLEGKPMKKPTRITIKELLRFDWHVTLDKDESGSVYDPLDNNQWQPVIAKTLLTILTKLNNSPSPNLLPIRDELSAIRKILTEIAARLPEPANTLKPFADQIRREADSRKRATEAYVKAGGTMDLQELPPKNTRTVAGLGLSVRPAKALRRLGVETIDQLTRLTSDELLGCKNFGLTSLAEVQEKLAKIGLRLRGEADLPPGTAAMLAQIGADPEGKGPADK